ncbi:MAG: hypothetical protein KME05_18535 [Gloeocapsa sp. UFS-A4-WI-NPMV-4B04]|jgi:hypothetical protein|nr:hypothetical protein [Gloeocapsa sp. UFS-A4-WI-NPMV-4B04]
MKVYFRNQASTVQCKVSIFGYSVTQSCEWVAKKASMATLIALLGTGGGLWTVSEAIAPQIAQANTERIEISLPRHQNETYQGLVNRAEAAALKSIEQSFAQDTQLTNVSIVIMGQNHGKIAPVLFLKVDRSEWLSNPALQHWVTYFRSARSLLGLQDAAATTATPRNISNPTTTKTITPTATTPNQTPTSSTDSGSQLPNTSTIITPATNVSPENPPTSTSVDNVVAPTAPVNNGTIINNPTTISVPNNRGLLPSNTPVSGVTRLIPNTSRNFTNTIPNATSPNQNVSPGTSPAGL